MNERDLLKRWQEELRGEALPWPTLPDGVSVMPEEVIAGWYNADAGEWRFLLRMGALVATKDVDVAVELWAAVTEQDSSKALKSINRMRAAARK